MAVIKLTTDNTTWFKVSRSPGGWAISKRKYSQTHMHRPPGWWGGDFETKEAAIDYGLAQGWTLVDNWTQAQEKAYGITQQRQAERDRIRKAREGLLRIEFELPNGKREVRYAHPDIIGAVLTELGQPDEFGIVQQWKLCAHVGCGNYSYSALCPEHHAGRNDGN